MHGNGASIVSLGAQPPVAWQGVYAAVPYLYASNELHANPL
jgi:hypothetical protein